MTICGSCGTDFFGAPKKCTCTYTCMTCGAETVGRPNHSGGRCPMADDTRTTAGAVLSQVLLDPASFTVVAGSLTEGNRDTASVWVRDTGTRKYFRIHVEELDTDTVEAMGLDPSLRR